MITVELYGIDFEVEYDLIPEETENNISEGVEILNVEHKGLCFWDMFEALGFEELKKEVLKRI